MKVTRVVRHVLGGVRAFADATATRSNVAYMAFVSWRHGEGLVESAFGDATCWDIEVKIAQGVEELAPGALEVSHTSRDQP